LQKFIKNNLCKVSRPRPSLDTPSLRIMFNTAPHAKKWSPVDGAQK